MKNIKLIALVLMAIMLTGCALRGSSNSDARDSGSTARSKALKSAPILRTPKKHDSEKAPSRLGRSSYVVMEMAKQHGCVGDGSADMTTESGPVEDYRVACEDGKTFMARCELRVCSEIKQ